MNLIHISVTVSRLWAYNGILFSELHVLYDTCCLDIIRGTDFVCMHWRVISHNCTFRDFEHYRLESLDRCRSLTKSIFSDFQSLSYTYSCNSMLKDICSRYQCWRSEIKDFELVSEWSAWIKKRISYNLRTEVEYSCFCQRNWHNL